MQKNKFESEGIYEHPAKHRAGTVGQVCLSGQGVYFLKVGGVAITCPQDWAAGIHLEELDRDRGRE